MSKKLIVGVLILAYLSLVMFLPGQPIIAADLVTAGAFQPIYDPSVGESTNWYINDHTIFCGPDGWHIYGITHAEPANPLDERNFAHATALSLTQLPWSKQAFALTYNPGAGEYHLWAPHVISNSGSYYMYYCAGSNPLDHVNYRIHLATSPDLWTWTRSSSNPMVVDGFDARDPMVLRVGSQWVMYYTGTNPASGGNYVVCYRTSTDLIHWGARNIAYTDPSSGTYGGPTESPFVVRRGTNYYLFVGPRPDYDGTDVFVSTSPYNWNIANKVGHFGAHAAEVIRDVDGKWYISRAGWGKGGVYLAQLTWSDGMSDSDTSMPAPAPVPTPTPSGTFNTNLTGWIPCNGSWSDVSGGKQGSFTGDAFCLASQSAVDFTYEGDLKITTSNTNNAAGLLFKSLSNPSAGSYVVNINIENGGQVKFFKFPYASLATYSTPISVGVSYHVKVVASGSNYKVYFNNGTTPVIDKNDTSYTSGRLGLNIYNSTSVFQNVNSNIAPTPTPSPTPTPGAVIFSDDFNDANLTGWTANGGTWTNPGTYAKVVCTGDAWDIYNATGTSFSYTGELKLVSGNAVGLSFRTNNNGTTGYDVIVDKIDGRIKLCKRPYVVLGSYYFTVNLNQMYTVKVVASGANLKVYLDNVEQINLNDSTYASGKFGMFGYNSTAQVDNVVARNY
jgi:arabinan endo-1,5-alpha-L-arabinosidase